MPGKILVIDDNRIIRESSMSLLRRRGYEACGAESGEEALKTIKQEPFDLLLLEIRMSGMDGIEILRRAVQLAPGIPILVLTGYGTIGMSIAALKHGAAGFLRKPVTIDVLQSEIEVVLGSLPAKRQAPKVTVS